MYTETMGWEKVPGQQKEHWVSGPTVPGPGPLSNGRGSAREFPVPGMLGNLHPAPLQAFSSQRLSCGQSVVALVGSPREGAMGGR